MSTDDTRMIFLKDYRPSSYLISEVEMTVEIFEGRTLVRSRLVVRPHANTAIGTPLVLDGDGLALEAIAVDGASLTEGDYTVDAKSLTVHTLPQGPFTLSTTASILPEANTELMGLYRSGGVWCTQCEPEGFRRITYFIDRPDVLAVYTVRIEADRAAAPVLLANGNLVESGAIDALRHYAVWHDPHPKPSYLFALVAGDLGAIGDRFVTRSGRAVALSIFCEHGKEDQCVYAMDALKRSMAWDEVRFGREYDLDVFNIVAVSDFNFGAMENKSLNIFNDKYVLARPETATDQDYAGIETVIAHEYFHNWTGNRITCRDWFQLCLKEGLTVYRDQEFTADERSRAVKRIEDVRGLRQSQFPEDAGPLAHPPRPDRYREINNFYTATVYQKGAEVVRMLATLLGEADFRRGMDLYFDRHDGEATTIEAFLACFAEASGRDLEQFALWYTQAGTPAVEASGAYDAQAMTYVLRLAQSVAPTPDQPDKAPFVLPIRFGLVGGNGVDLAYSRAQGAAISGDVIVLDTEAAEIVFEGVSERPVPSLFRGFSAPVRLALESSAQDLAYLAGHDGDPFNRWQALQTIAMDRLSAAARGAAPDDETVDLLARALDATLADPGLDPAFKALSLSLPTESLVARALKENVDPSRVHAARNDLIVALGHRLERVLAATYDAPAGDAPYAPTAEQAGRRSLRNQALTMMVGAGLGHARAAARDQYAGALNMTDRLAALSALVLSGAEGAMAVLEDFHRRYAADALVLDKWLALTALAPDIGVIERIRAVLAAPDFPIGNPNRLRALVGSFAMSNAVQFARPDGEGFRFVAGFCGEIDGRNPAVAARILTAFRVWKSYEPVRRTAAREALETLAQRQDLSRNTSDILVRMLGE